MFFLIHNNYIIGKRINSNITAIEFIVNSEC